MKLGAYLYTVGYWDTPYTDRMILQWVMTRTYREAMCTGALQVCYINEYAVKKEGNEEDKDYKA